MVGADVPGGPPPARGAAGRPTTEPRAGVGCRRARGTRAPTNVGVLMCQGQPTWEARADATRRGRHGYFARGDVGGRLWIWPWVGCWSRAAQGPAATSAALPCRRGAGDAGFHIGTVPPGRYAVRRRAKYPRRVGTGRPSRARHRARPRQARPSRVAEVKGTRDFTSEQFRSEIPHHQTHGGSVAVLRSAQKEREKVCVWGGGVVGADVPGGPTPARNAVGRLTAWARAGARDARTPKSGIGREQRAWARAGARDARPYQCRCHSIVRHAGAIVRHIGAIVRQGQPTWEIRADVPRRGWRGYIARRGSVHVREL